MHLGRIASTILLAWFGSACPQWRETLSDMETLVRRIGSGYHLVMSVLPQRINVPAFAYLAFSPACYAEKLSFLRPHYRHRIFAAGANDITESRDVYEFLGE